MPEDRVVVLVVVWCAAMVQNWIELNKCPFILFAGFRRRNLNCQIGKGKARALIRRNMVIAED
jgi:hypothetical protein